MDSRVCFIFGNKSSTDSQHEDQSKKEITAWMVVFNCNCLYGDVPTDRDGKAFGIVFSFSAFVDLAFAVIMSVHFDCAAKPI